MFAPRSSRYKISNQNRQGHGVDAPPSVDSRKRVPQAPDDILTLSDQRIPDISRLKVFVAKTANGDYYAGYTNSAAILPNWPTGQGLEILFEPNERLVKRKTVDGLLTLAAETPGAMLRIAPQTKNGQEIFGLEGLLNAKSTTTLWPWRLSLLLRPVGSSIHKALWTVAEERWRPSYVGEVSLLSASSY